MTLEYDDDEFEDLLRFLDLSSGQLELRSGRVFRHYLRGQSSTLRRPYLAAGMYSMPSGEEVFRVLAEGEFERSHRPEFRWLPKLNLSYCSMNTMNCQCD